MSTHASGIRPAIRSLAAPSSSAKRPPRATAFHRTQSRRNAPSASTAAKGAYCKRIRMPSTSRKPLENSDRGPAIPLPSGASSGAAASNSNALARLSESSSSLNSTLSHQTAATNKATSAWRGDVSLPSRHAAGNTHSVNASKAIRARCSGSNVPGASR